MMYKGYGSQEYRQQDVMGASPVRLVVMTYDLAIKACEQEDFVQATKTIGALRDALNFDYGSVALGLFRLYQWCLDCIRQGDYKSALHTLTELRDAWAAVEKRLTPATAVPLGSHPSVALAAA